MAYTSRIEPAQAAAGIPHFGVKLQTRTMDTPTYIVHVLAADDLSVLLKSAEVLQMTLYVKLYVGGMMMETDSFHRPATNVAISVLVMCMAGRNRCSSVIAKNLKLSNLFF